MLETVRGAVRRLYKSQITPVSAAIIIVVMVMMIMMTRMMIRMRKELHVVAGGEPGAVSARPVPDCVRDEETRN